MPFCHNLTPLHFNGHFSGLASFIEAKDDGSGGENNRTNGVNIKALNGYAMNCNRKKN